MYIFLGNKDDLVLRLYLLKHDRKHLIGLEEKRDVKMAVKIAEQLVIEQLKCVYVNPDHIQRVRKYGSDISSSARTSVHIQSPEKLTELFEGLKILLEVKVTEADKKSTSFFHTTQTTSNKEVNLQYERYE